MIRTISREILIISFFLLLVGTLGAWAIAWKLNGEKEDAEFLKILGTIAVFIFCVQVTIFFYMKKRIFLQLIFLSICGLSLVWFMLALVFPILWVDILGVKTKLVLYSILIVLSICNVFEAFRRFNEKWTGLDQVVRVKKLERNGDTINWDKLSIFMDLSGNLYIPGLSRSVSMIISVLLVISMILGFILKTTFPVFSAIAWGVPSILMVSVLFQMIGYNLAQACRVRILEKEHGVFFRQKT